MEAQVNMARKLLSRVKWTNKDYELCDFILKFGLPQIAKVSHGNYMYLGAPSSHNSSSSQVILLGKEIKRLKIAAYCVNFKENGKFEIVGDRIGIPDNFDGWFEILSENGRESRCLESVAELIGMSPDKCLVRENISAQVSKANSSSIKRKIIKAGEVLTLERQIIAPTKSKSSFEHYLRCLRENGDLVYLDADEGGMFSPVADEHEISGVHSVHNLLGKKLPLMVRLISGEPLIGLRRGYHHPVEMRIHGVFEEENIIAIPLSKRSRPIALPTAFEMKVRAPEPSEMVMRQQLLHTLTESCKEDYAELSDKIYPFDSCMSIELKFEEYQHRRKPLMEQRSLDRLDKAWKCNLNRETEVKRVDIESSFYTINRRYKEIDDIYNEVRGIIPPKGINTNKRLPPKRSSIDSSPCSSLPCTSGSTPSSGEDTKPEPPPIETIPIRRMERGENQFSFPVNVKVITQSDDSVITNGHIYEEIDSCLTISNSKTAISNQTEPSQSRNHAYKKFPVPSSSKTRIQSKCYKQIHTLTASAQNKATSTSSFIETPTKFNVRYSGRSHSLERVERPTMPEISTMSSAFALKPVSLNPAGNNSWNQLISTKSLADFFEDRDLNCIDNLSVSPDNRRSLFRLGRLVKRNPKYFSALFL